VRRSRSTEGRRDVAGWKRLDHTADLALEAWGGTPEEALEALCTGLLRQITDPERVRPLEATPLLVEGMDREEAVVGFLGELLYQIYGKGQLFNHVAVHSVGTRNIRGEAWGEPRDPSRHTLDLEVKAATYYDLRFERDSETGGWRIRVVFDV